MTPQIDLTALKARHHAARSDARPQADTWFQLAGRSGQESYELTAAACAAIGPGARPHATVAGTFVEFFMPDWVRCCQQVARQLEDAGEVVVVSVPPTPPWPLAFDELTLPCLVLIHRLDPPAEAVPHSERTAGHWTLPAAAARHRLNTATEWVIPAGAFGAVGELGMIPATREDAPAKLGSLFKDIFRIYLNGYREDGSLDREVTFKDWGVSTWRASYRGMTQLEGVEALCELLLEFGAELELGAITLSSTKGSGGLAGRDHMIPWPAIPQLWAAYVPDVHPIQILNDQHLAKANDLSSWLVETISPGRHLVRAKNLQPWFNLAADQDRIDRSTATLREVPPTQLLNDARQDFGDMIITREVITSYHRALKDRSAE